MLAAVSSGSLLQLCEGSRAVLVVDVSTVIYVSGSKNIVCYT